MFNSFKRRCLLQAASTLFGAVLLVSSPALTLAADALRMDDDPPSTIATVNSVDIDRRKIDITHDPVPDISWPSMRMVLPVAPSVNLEEIKQGAKAYVTFARDTRSGWLAAAVEPVRQPGR